MKSRDCVPYPPKTTVPQFAAGIQNTARLNKQMTFEIQARVSTDERGKVEVCKEVEAEGTLGKSKKETKVEGKRRVGNAEKHLTSTLFFYSGQAG